MASTSAVCGPVTGIDDCGHARVLRRGEPVHADETLVAALDAAATVRLLSGGELFVAPGGLVMLDADLLEYDESAAATAPCIWRTCSACCVGCRQQGASQWLDRGYSSRMGQLPAL